jgi:hypothetical protein
MTPMPRLTTAYPLRAILNKAWILARADARRFDGSVRSYLAAAMRSVWAEQKAARAEVEAMRQRVLAAVANLAAEAREMESLTAEWGARLGLPGCQPRRAATVVPFPPRRPAVVPAAGRRAA